MYGKRITILCGDNFDSTVMLLLCFTLAGKRRVGQWSSKMPRCARQPIFIVRLSFVMNEADSVEILYACLLPLH